MQTVDYTVSTQDIIAFNQFHHGASPHSRRLLRLLQLASAVAITAACTLPLQNNRPLLPIGPWLVFAAAFILLVPALFRWSIRRSARRQLAEGHNQGILGPRRLEVRDTALVELSDSGEQHTRWHAVEKVEVSEGHVFVYLSATAGYTVPREAFADNAAVVAFVAAVREKIAAP